MRKFKKEILEFLEQENFENNLNDLHKFPSKKVINTLFPFLCSTNRRLKENAIAAMGEIMARSKRMAEEYHKLLISYTPGRDNYLDFEELQKDVIADN